MNDDFFLPSITNARCAHVSDGGRCQRGDANIRTLSADDNAERYAVTVKQLVVICCLVEQNLNQERCFFSPLCIHNGKKEESSYLPPCWTSSISAHIGACISTGRLSCTLYVYMYVCMIRSKGSDLAQESGKTHDLEVG